MYRRFNTLSYVIFGLIAIGIFAKFLTNPKHMIIPLLVFGIVFYFLKFPPGRRSAQKPYSSTTRQKAKSNTKKTHFRVIRGNKSDESDDPPKYH